MCEVTSFNVIGKADKLASQIAMFALFFKENR